ncbi:MAG: hypothetical protein K2O03_05140 [Lachnospiraceae bacterium]|nr:hypothetical protein [Lachnospiraceae bacterium]
MKRIEHTISFTIPNGNYPVFVSRLAEELISYLTGDIGLSLINRTSSSSEERLIFQYKDLKPYICVFVNYSGNQVNIYGTNAFFDGSFQGGARNTEVISLSSTYTLKTTIRILMSETFFSIKFNSSALSDIGYYGVALFNVKNFRTGEEKNVFTGRNCLSFMYDSSTGSSLVQKFGESSFEGVGYAILTPRYNFVGKNTLLFPAFLSQNFNEVFYTDWYIDELFVSLLGGFTAGAKYRIDGKTYFAVTHRCLAELTQEIID